MVQVLWEEIHFLLPLKEVKKICYFCFLCFFFPPLKNSHLPSFFCFKSKKRKIRSGVTLALTHLPVLPSFPHVHSFQPPQAWGTGLSPLLHSSLGRSRDLLPLPTPQKQLLKPRPRSLKGNLLCNISSSFWLFKNLILQGTGEQQSQGFTVSSKQGQAF